VRIEQSGSAIKNWWSIGEINILRSGINLADKQALSSKGWVIYASSNPLVTADAIDGKASSRWSTSTRQQPGQFLQIDMLKNQRIDGIVLDSQGNPFDYPRGYTVHVSNDAVQWGEAIATGVGTQAVTNIQFSARSARYIRIEQTGSDSNHWWSVHELTVYQAPN
jgi:F5/8 type C domain